MKICYLIFSFLFMTNGLGQLQISLSRGYSVCLRCSTFLNVLLEKKAPHTFMSKT